MALFDENVCLACGREINANAWKLVETGLFVGACGACGAIHHLWEYREGRCVARPGEPQAAFEPAEPTPAQPAQARAVEPPQAPQRGKLKRGEVDPMQAPLFGSGKK